MAADALVLKVREGGRVVPVHVLVATGVNADGHREILGVQAPQISSSQSHSWVTPSHPTGPYVQVIPRRPVPEHRRRSRT